MGKNNIYNVPFKRKRKGKTYYKKRLKLLGSGAYRLVIRKSLKNVQVSIVEYSQKGDRVLFTVGSNALDKMGWKGGNGNLPSAYLVGMMAGKKAIEKGIKGAILDIGFNNSVKGSRLYAALAGALDAGLKVPFSQEVIPAKERISGMHIAKYAESLKSNKQGYDKQFSDYIKKGLNPEDIVKHFNEIKGKVNE